MNLRRVMKAMDTENNPDNNYNDTDGGQEVNIEEFKKDNPNSTIQISNPVELKPESTAKVTNGPSQFVLQWLTYAFWGWTVIATSYVIVTMLIHFFESEDIGFASLYGTAALLVLLPISIVCDIFYSKHEPEKKVGASSVVMVIHAVVFALAGIGSLISAVWALVTLYVSLSDTVGAQILLYSSLSVSVLFTIIFLRTIIPGRLFWLRRYFLIGMSVIIGIISLISFIGPVASARLTMVDKLIESNLGEVKYAIDEYAENNDKLPSSLQDIKLDNDAKKLIDDNLVEYKKDSGVSFEDDYYDKVYYYQLCVTYKEASKNDSYDRYERTTGSNDYEDYLYTYYHPKGEVCYKLKNSVYDKKYSIPRVPIEDAEEI